MNQFMHRLYHIGTRYRNIYSKGLLVVLLGCDGAGKSTVARQTVSLLNKNGMMGKSRILHWRPGLFPHIRHLVNPGARSEKMDVVIPHTVPPHNSIVSLVRFLYYVADFILGYYLKILPHKVAGNLTIIERYYYDFLIDPLRYRFKLPKGILRIFMAAIPRPDVIIYLDTPTKTLIDRKQELPIEELERQSKEFEKLVLELPHVHRINTDRDLECVVFDVSHIIQECIFKRSHL